MGKHIALLKGINVGGHRRVPMADLRSVAEASGFTRTRTYVASGNLLLESREQPAAIEAALECEIEQRFGFFVDVIVRPQEMWMEYQDHNPFSVESQREPKLVMICVGKQQATEEDVAALRSRAGENERVERRDDVLWLYFGDGPARSKMGLGSGRGVWTTRNWTTVCKIAELFSN